MTSLVLCIGAGKGTWAEARKLMGSEGWERVFIVTNSFGKENFQAENAEFVVIDDRQPVSQIASEITAGLKGKIRGVETALNFVSGGGKEHMALVSALLKLGLAVRLVVASEKGMEEL